MDCPPPVPTFLMALSKQRLRIRFFVPGSAGPRGSGGQAGGTLGAARTGAGALPDAGLAGTWFMLVSGTRVRGGRHVG